MQLKSYIEAAPNGYGPHLICDYDQAKAFIEENSSRIIIVGPDGKDLHRALQMRKDGYAVILLSREVLKAWRCEIGDIVRVEIKADTSKYGMAFPEEFEIVLEQDPEAKAEFEARKPGKQRGVLHYIDSAKSEEARIKRALEIAEKLKNHTLYGES